MSHVVKSHKCQRVSGVRSSGQNLSVENPPKSGGKFSQKYVIWSLNGTSNFMKRQLVSTERVMGNAAYYLITSVDHNTLWTSRGSFRMEKGNFLQEFIAGNVGGLIGICVVYPLDTAKIRMQTHPNYRSTSDVLRKMIQNDGFGSLYRGLASPALGFGLTFAISFRFLKIFLLKLTTDFLSCSFLINYTYIEQHLWILLSPNRSAAQQSWR